MDEILCKKEVFYFKFMLVRSDILYHRGESNIFLVQPEIRKNILWKEKTVCDNDLMKKMYNVDKRMLNQKTHNLDTRVVSAKAYPGL